MKRKSAMVAVIFDLDNCLCPATAVGEALFAPTFNALREANRGVLDDSMLQRAIADCWHTSFDVVAERYGFSTEMIDAGNTAFGRVEVKSPLIGYADLPVVRELPVKRYLVTAVFRRVLPVEGPPLRTSDDIEQPRTAAAALLSLAAKT